MAKPKPSSDTIRVGRIVGAFGIKGQVKIEPLTEYLDRFKAGARLRLRGDWVEIETSTIHKGRPLIKFRGVSSTNDAESLQWEYLEAPAGQRPDLEEDEFLVTDLIGLEVVTIGGKVIGVIDDVLPNPAHDILDVEGVLIPFVDQFVKSIDWDEETVVVDLIPGMLPDDEEA